MANKFESYFALSFAKVTSGAGAEAFKSHYPAPILDVVEFMDHSQEQEQGPPTPAVIHVQLPPPTVSYPVSSTTPLWCSLHGRWLPPGRPLFYNRGTEFWLLVR